MEPEPKPTVEELIAASESEKVANELDNRHDAWGQRGWARVAELCRWLATMGAKYNCPAAPLPDSRASATP